VQNIEMWKPTKFVPSAGRWVCSPNHSELGRGSRFSVGIMIDAYKKAIEPHASGHLLDLGCGKVPLYGMYRALVEDVTCVDWPNSTHGSRHVDHFVDLNGPLPFDPAMFDTILLTDVLEHIARPDELWREMTRVLRPGGKVIVTVPFLYPIHEEPHDYHRYTGYKLRHFCEAVGLFVIYLEPYGGALEVILDLVAKHLYRHPLLSRLHLSISRLLMKIGPLKAISDDTRQSFPMGYCLVAQKPHGTAVSAG
jgi:SAM-dependent methyltransferase